VHGDEPHEEDAVCGEVEQVVGQAQAGEAGKTDEDRRGLDSHLMIAAAS
jgi:hypothetical protein